MKLIPLTQGFSTMVDDEYYEELNKHKWYAHRHNNAFYAQRNQKRGEYSHRRSRKTIFMHHAIMGDKKIGIDIDHINHNTLDNRKENLRLCTHAENRRNSMSVIGTSRYKGVCWHKKKRVWLAQISYNNRTEFLGHYSIEIDAARAYDNKAKELFGEFANINFKEE
jgi:hypothetical protein